MIGTGIVALLIGVPTFLWTTNQPFRKTIKTAYANVMDPARRFKTNQKPAKVAKKPTFRGSAVSGNSFSSPRTREEAGTREVLTPDLTGRTYEDAVSTAREEKLKVIKSDKGTYNTQFGEGIVYQQSPAAGAYVAERTAIYVRISKGDPPEAGTAGGGEATENNNSSDQ